MKITKHNKYLLKPASQINSTAQLVYGAIQGGNELNFFLCNAEYENGRFGWVKENTAFETAIQIYEEYTANDGYDIVNEIREEFPDIDTMDVADLKKIFKEIL